MRGIIEPGGRQPVARGGAAKQRNPGVCKKMTRTPNVGWQKAWLKKITAPSVTHSMGSGSFFVGAGAARAIARLHLPYLCRPLRGSKFRSANTPANNNLSICLLIVLSRKLYSLIAFANFDE